MASASAVLLLTLVEVLQNPDGSKATSCGISPVCQRAKLLGKTAEVALQCVCYAGECSIVLGTLLQLGQLQRCLPEHC